MEQFSREQIRTLIILGFVLVAIADVITFVNSVSSIDFPFTLRGIVDALVDPLATIAAVCAWAALTRVEARDGLQANPLRHAYLFFAIEYVMFAIGYNFLYTPIRNYGGFWNTTSLWLEFIGTLVTAVGLFLMWRTFALNDDARTRPT